ncbi:MAG: hypothetical protein WDW38_008456 [Sanguina aurantia]
MVAARKGAKITLGNIGAKLGGGSSPLDAPPQTKLVKPKTRKGMRVLEDRAPKMVEDVKKSLILYGGQTSQVIKDLLTDLHRLKGEHSVKFTRKNEDVRPFEPGGETSLEFYGTRSDCALFVLGSHTKKRPHNVVMGRLFDGRLYDALELGVSSYAGVHKFKAGTISQIGSKPAIIFLGEKFESVPALKQAKSVLLDFFRGEAVESVNLAGLDRVMVAAALGDNRLLLRQYAIKFRKSGGKVPRVALQEMGPRLEMATRRCRAPPMDLQTEAMKQPKLGKKKEKNISMDELAGKVGRIYMPPQKMDTLALGKLKGVRREKREKAAAKKSAKQNPPAAAVAAPAAL